MTQIDKRSAEVAFLSESSKYSFLNFIVWIILLNWLPLIQTSNELGAYLGKLFPNNGH